MNKYCGRDFASMIMMSLHHVLPGSCNSACQQHLQADCLRSQSKKASAAASYESAVCGCEHPLQAIVRHKHFSRATKVQLAMYPILQVLTHACAQDVPEKSKHLAITPQS